MSDGKYLSTKYLTDLIAKYLSKKPKYFKVNMKTLKFLAMLFNRKNLLYKVIGDFKVNNDELNKDIGWYPKYKFESGIKKTCFWYKTMFKIKS